MRLLMDFDHATEQKSLAFLSCSGRAIISLLKPHAL